MMSATIRTPKTVAKKLVSAILRLIKETLASGDPVMISE